MSKADKWLRPKDPMTVTSVNIRESQKKFLKDNGIELSAVTRDAIEEIIKAKEKLRKAE